MKGARRMKDMLSDEKKYPHSVKILTSDIGGLKVKMAEMEEVITGLKNVRICLQDLVEDMRTYLDYVENHTPRRGSKNSFPELPNGEGVITESELLQGPEAPRGCEPASPGDGGYYVGSSTDPRD